MGREVMRVALDFNWPVDKVWPGYLIPYCEDVCEDQTCSWCKLRERVEPPAGDGWQVWETVSEGSPISPVFPTREALMDWLCSDAYNWGVSRPLTREQAEHFTSTGWAPTLIASARTGVIPGEQWIPDSAGAS